MTSNAIFNRLPGAGVGTNKRKSALIFNRMLSHYQHDYNFVPLTYVLPEQTQQLKSAMAKGKGKRTFILKPSGGAEGCGIMIV